VILFVALIRPQSKTKGEMTKVQEKMYKKETENEDKP
jgi:hypothetical protein